jgi:agmatinase
MDHRIGGGGVRQVTSVSSNNQSTAAFGGPDAMAPDITDARVVVLPLCYEVGPSYGTGSRNGPLCILSASVQLETIDEETRTDWTRPGIHTHPPFHPSGDPETAVSQMEAAAAGVLEKGRMLISLGGDHAVSIGPVLAAAKRFPDLGVVQIDAHPDLRDTWNGSRFNHGCVMRRIAEAGSISIFPVGIRTISAEELSAMETFSISPLYAHDIPPGDLSWIDAFVSRLPPMIYLTIDLDGLDPACVPGTGTPEPGGLTYRQVTALIGAIGRSRQVVAADVTELAEIEGHRHSEYTAARLVQKIIAFCAPPKTD